MESYSYDAIVVGAGHNGLACAALLAKAGRTVAVFERNAEIGGAAVSDTNVWPGYTLSAASYVCSLLDPWLVDDLDLRGRGLDFYRKDPYAFTPLEDGRSLLLGGDAAANAREIAAFDPADVAGFEAYGERVERAGRALFDSFSDADPASSDSTPDTQALLLGSAAELVERYVRTPVLAAELVNDGLIGTNLGPRDAGTGYVLAHHLAGRVLGIQGAWAFVRGGMGAVSQALADAARAYGAEIFAGAGVERIVTYEDRAMAVALERRPRDFGHARSRATRIRARRFSICSTRARCPRSSTERVKRWKTVGPSLKLNLALGELPNFSARPGTQPAAASPRDDPRRPVGRLPAKGVRRRGAERRERRAADRVLSANADRSVAGAARQAYPLGLRAILSVRSRRRLVARQARGGGRRDRRDPRPARAESSQRDRAPAQCSLRPISRRASG